MHNIVIIKMILKIFFMKGYPMIKKIKIRFILKKFYKYYRILLKSQLITSFEKEYIERMYSRLKHDNMI